MEAEKLQKLFKQVKNSRVIGRYLPYPEIVEELRSLPKKFEVKSEARSVSGRPIYSVAIGTGPTKILLWSQMHGNETTTTKAVLDFLNAVKKEVPLIEEILTACRIKLIPILNPDGAVAYTRKNANEIDLNRDAVHKTQPEMRYLQETAEEFAPDFCFNMHDQRTIYGVGDTHYPATLSFLSPASNAKRRVGASREMAMQIIGGVNKMLQSFIPGKIGRYDDTYNPNCIGDFFQRRGIPTLLFEAGHFPGDYGRERTRKIVFMAFCEALHIIVNKRNTEFKPSAYFRIPENRKSFYDVIVRNINAGGYCADLAIQYEEVLQEGKIEFLPKIAEIQNLNLKHGHLEIEAQGQKINNLAVSDLKKGNIVKKITLINEEYPLSLTNN